MSDAYTIAFKLLTLGFSVIPSGGGDKHKAPLVNWQQYQNTPPTEDQLETWNQELKPRLWGIITNGKLAVLDADTPSVRALIETEIGPPHVSTPRLGGHWYLDTAGHPLKTIAWLLPSIDIRGVGGFANIAGGKYDILTLPVPDTLIPWGKLPKRILDAMAAGSNPTPAIDPDTPIPDGRRNATLTRIAGSMRRQSAPQEAILAALQNIPCETPLPDAEIRAIATSIGRYTPAETKPDPEPPMFAPVSRLVSEVAPVDVSWLWKPYIPFGKLTLLEGDPGIGKSWIALAIATAISLGHGLPSLNGNHPLAPVLIASAEDGIADTIRPRLDAMSADVGAIVAIDGLFTLDDEGFAYLEAEIAKWVPGLVIIDPLVAYLSGELDIHKANQVRHSMARLAKLADKYGLAIVAVRHLTKGGSSKAIYRGLGSIDFTASARSVLLAGADPDDEDIRGLVHLKSNLAAKGPPIGFELREDRFYWTDGCSLTSEKILMALDNSGPLDEAKNFIQDTLSGGAVAASEVQAEAKGLGITATTLNRGKKALGVETFRTGEAGKQGGGAWHWKMPGGKD